MSGLPMKLRKKMNTKLYELISKLRPPIVSLYNPFKLHPLGVMFTPDSSIMCMLVRSLLGFVSINRPSYLTNF